MTRSRPYHHGDLRRSVLDAAVELIAERGPAPLSLRELARRAGVSHAAPAHHFTDKAGVLTAIAVQGYDLLAEEMAGSEGELKELGVRYVRFAAAHPAHFEVMYRPELYHRDAPELVSARARTAGLLRTGVGSPADPRDDREAELAALAAWSLAHGFAALWRSGNLDRLIERHDPAELFRGVAAHMFTPT